MRRLAAAVLCASLPAAGACGGGTGGGPPEILWGEHECSFCRMIVSEPRHAAAARSPGGREARFDDLGCAVAFLRRAPDAAAWRVWVRPAGRDGWLPATEAAYARLDRLVTPMGSGLAAFADRAAARSAAAGGDVLTWNELLAESRLPAPAGAEARPGPPA